MGNQQQNVTAAGKDWTYALGQALPGILQAYNSTLAPTAQAQYEANAAWAPKEAALQTQIYGEQGPALNKIGSDIDRANQLAGAETTRQVAEGPGKALVASALASQKELDPEFYHTRELVAGGLDKAINGQDPNMLTVSELENESRGLARTPGGFMPSAQNTLRNAGVFGNALTQKRQLYNQTLAGGAAALSPLKSGLTGYEISTGRPLTSNVGQQTYTGANLGQGQQGYNAFNTGANALAGFQNTAMGKQKSTLDQVMGWGEVGGKAVGAAAGAICWVAREVYGEDNPAWVIFRHWLITTAPAWFKNLYIRFGERFANWIKNKPRLKLFIRGWMNSRIATLTN